MFFDGLYKAKFEFDIITPERITTSLEGPINILPTFSHQWLVTIPSTLTREKLLKDKIEIISMDLRFCCFCSHT